VGDAQLRGRRAMALQGTLAASVRLSRNLARIPLGEYYVK
jgi:hypothetical protein